MDDALLVRRLERLCDLLRDRQRVVERNRAARDPLRQIVTLDEFHDERTHPAGFFEAVDVRDVRVVQGCEGLGFAREPSKPVRIVRKRVREDLERDIAIQPGIARAIDLSHAPFADRRGDFVDAETSTGREGQTAEDYRGTTTSETRLVLKDDQITNAHAACSTNASDL